MRKPTPVTTASMIIVRWSTLKAKSTWKPVIWSQGPKTFSIERGAPGCRITIQIQATTQAGIAVNRSAMAETAARGRRRPRVPLMRKPANGLSGMSQRRLGFMGSVWAVGSEDWASGSED